MAEEKEKIVQYIIVREAFFNKYGHGRTAPQIAHASIAFLQNKFHDEKEIMKLVLDETIQQWMNSPTKVVLIADEDEFEYIKYYLPKFDIVHEVIAEPDLDNTETCIGFAPYNKETVFKFVEKLRLFK